MVLDAWYLAIGVIAGAVIGTAVHFIEKWWKEKHD